MSYTYDQDGVTFYYFILTALAVYLIPATVSRTFGRKRSASKSTSPIVPGYAHKKTKAEGEEKKGFLSWNNLIYGFCLVLFAVLLQAVWNAKVEYKAFDPYEILGVDTSATDEQVAKAFKKLSRKYHPDKAEDKATAESLFIEISKAYKSLTDPVAKKNWEDYGNPDGPRGFSLGIALPAWLVDKTFGPYVLALYLLAFMIGVPYFVSRNWSHTKLYTKDKILHSTMAVYFQQMKEAMSFKKVFDLLASSLEFKQEFTLRPEDAKAIDELIESIAEEVKEQGGEKYEKPKSLTEDWQVKAHVLLYAHMNRFTVKNAHLKTDQQLMVTKACHLTLGMLQIALARQWLQTASQCIALVQCLVQAVWEGQSSLLQLPYADNQIVKYAKGRKNPIKTIRQLVEMPEEERRTLLKSLSDDQYATLINIAKTFPEVIIESAKFVTLGQPHVIPGGLVTVKLKLRIVRAGEKVEQSSNDDIDDVEVENFEFDEDGNLIDSAPVKSIGKGDENVPQPIFCPHYPYEKHPYWWVVITNVLNTAIVTAPVKVVDLVDSKIVTLQFTAPGRPGQIAVNLHVKSDCLIGVDTFKTFAINILPMKEVPRENWGISGDESDSSVGGGCGDSGCGHAH